MCHHELDGSQVLKTFLMRPVVMLTNMIFLILYNEICQHLEDLHKAVNIYFSNHYCMMLQNCVWVEDTIKV